MTIKSTLPLLLCLLACEKESSCEEDSGACDTGKPLVDTASLTLPDATQERWEWEITGEAGVVFADGLDSTWEGSSRWSFRDVDSEEVVCEALLKTNARGQEPKCEEDSRCDWAFFVSHVTETILQGDCEGTVGMSEGRVAASWALGYSSSWDSEPRLIAYVTTEVEGESAQWSSIGDAQFDGSDLSYSFDPVGFFVFRD